MSETVPDKLLSVSVVAKRLRRSVKTIRRLIRSGELAAYNIGTLKRPEYRISEKEYKNYLRRKNLAFEKTMQIADN